MVENISGPDYLHSHYQWSSRPCSPPIYPSRKYQKRLFPRPDVVGNDRDVPDFCHL